MHRNKINGKIYIGQTCQNPQKRWDNGRGYETSTRFFNAILKYGWDNFEHSEETKQKIGKANSQSLKGKTHSTEWSQIMSEKFSGQGNPFYGKHHTEETKQKISQNRKGKLIGQNHPFYGKHHTKDSLQKISEHRQGKGGKRILCLNTNEVFECMMDAARWCGLKTSASIGQCCMGHIKTAGIHPITKERLKWKYLDE